MSEWREIATAPVDDDGWVSRALLARRQSWGWEMWVGQCDGGMWLGREPDGCCFDTDLPTHWMPLPDPPENDRRVIDIDIPHNAEERERLRLTVWDRWYETLPADLRRKLSLDDFKRLGDCFKQAFGVREILPPTPPLSEWRAEAERRNKAQRIASGTPT